MPDFNYWLLAASPEPPFDGFIARYTSHSAAMADARQVKFQDPSLRVVVEVLPAGVDHPDLMSAEVPGGLGGDRG